MIVEEAKILYEWKSTNRKAFLLIVMTINSRFIQQQMGDMAFTKNSQGHESFDGERVLG